MITSFFSPKKKKITTTTTTTDSTSSTSTTTTSTGKRNAVDNDDSEKNSPTGERKRTKPSSSITPSSFLQPSTSLSPEVVELLSYLEGSNDGNSQPPPQSAVKTWKSALLRHTSTPGFASLAKFVASERTKNTIYPPPNDTFSALNLTPLHKVKVVIVGQDPYHGPNQGHGLAFSVRKGVAIPPSLRNIYKELKNDPNVSFPTNGLMPTHGFLERWAKQGVILLNAVLTVKAHCANSHAKRGWENFTDEIIRILDRESRNSNGGGSSGSRGLVFLLWGKPASKKTESIIQRGGGSKNGRRQHHAIICTSHPSPLGASKTSSPFLGSKCFSRANDALKERGLEPIDWNVDGELPGLELDEKEEEC